MYCLAITRDFIAQHYLVGGDWGPENVQHSHHYRVEITIEGHELDRHGYLVDLVDLDKMVCEVIDEVRDRVLNDLPSFAGLNPSLERFSRIFWEMLSQKVRLPGKTLGVKLWENETDWASCRASL